MFHFICFSSKLDILRYTNSVETPDFVDRWNIANPLGVTFGKQLHFTIFSWCFKV